MTDSQPTRELIAAGITDRLPLDQLNPFPGNARRGDLAAIREMLLSHGQIEPLVVNRGTLTGRPNELVAGNNRAQVMQSLGWAEAGVTYIDVDDTEVRKLNVGLNRTGDLAQNDERALAAILASIAAESSLIGTGYSDAAYDELMRATDTYGDAASGFLGDLLGGNPEPSLSDPAPRPAPRPTDDPVRDEDDGQLPVGPSYVTVSWTVLPEERDTVRSALKHAQSRWQTGTSASALVQLCHEYLREV